MVLNFATELKIYRIAKLFELEAVNPNLLQVPREPVTLFVVVI